MVGCRSWHWSEQHKLILLFLSESNWFISALLKSSNPAKGDSYNLLLLFLLVSSYPEKFKSDKMKKNKLTLLSIMLVSILFFFLSSCNNKESNICLDNGNMELAFNFKSGALVSFRNLADSCSFFEEEMSSVSPWEIELQDASVITTIDINSASRFRHWNPNDTTLILEWDQFRDLKLENLSVTALVNVDKNNPMSFWRISLAGTKGLQVNKVAFPRIKINETEGDEFLAVPEWMGQVIKGPREYLSGFKTNIKKFEWSYPGPLSMQCVALYTPAKRGFYAACNDTMAFRKNMAFTLDSAGNLLYQLNSFPPADTSSAYYEPSYSAIVGSFRGDWITAASIYREWGAKQKWCRESRFANNKTPAWLEKTSLWVWNRGKSSNVLVPASDIQKRIDLPVSVFWHWWHGCSYDDGFPEYIPPREGKRSFLSAMSTAHENGINAIVYMNQALWGTTTESWKNEGAEKFAAKDPDGKNLTHVFNIFTGKPTAYMCMATQFWKDKYSSLCDSAVNTYTADGVYMDMACLNTMCFDRSHGHPVGGGNYHLQNFGKMTALIRSKINDKENLVLAGEGAGEVWLPYLDLFLTLAVSKERYAGPGAWETIPFFQAVYHQYSVTYGNYSSLLVPPYDELWPKKYAPKEPLKMLDKAFSKQFLMEQARSFVWGLQPTISNYQSFLASERKVEIDFLIDLVKIRNQGSEFLLHGKFLRTPSFTIPIKEIDISRLSIYAGKMGESVTSFKGSFPMVYSGTWQSESKNIGIALASISDEPFRINFSIISTDYELASSGSLYVIDSIGRRYISSYSKGEISVDYTLKPKGLCIIEITGDRPKN